MNVTESDCSTMSTKAARNEVANENVIVMDITLDEGAFIETMHCETVTDTIEQDPALKVGSRFNDYQSFEDALHLYSLENNLVYTTLKSASINRRNKVRREKNLKLYNPKLKVSTLMMGCKHYGTKKSRAKGIRPKQTTYKTGCNSQINLALDASTQTLVVTRFLTEHNHDVSRDMAENYPERRRLSMQETLAMEERLRDPGLKARQVQDIVRSTLHKHVSSKDVHNFRASLRKPRKEPPPMEIVNEDELLQPGEAPPYTPRFNKRSKKPRAKKPVVPRIAISEPLEYSTESLEEQQVEERTPGHSDGEASGPVEIFNGNVAVKLEADCEGGQEVRYDCVEYLDTSYGEQDDAEERSQSVEQVNESWKCVYKLLEADNVALKRDVARLRAQLAGLKRAPCASCGAAPTATTRS